MRKTATFSHEQALWDSGVMRIVGIDEVGRGAWAGPLVAAGVIFSKKVRISGITDSKLLNEKAREELSEKIKEKSLTWTVVEISPEEIDMIGVGEANARAISEVISKLIPAPQYALIDQAFLKSQNISIPYETIVKGDQKIFSIAAASILAKVARDTIMRQYAKNFPEYGFDTHVGYGTAEHQKALKKYGITPLHRRSYKPVSQQTLF